MLWQRFDRRDGNLPDVADIFYESGKRAERESWMVMTGSDHRCKGTEILAQCHWAVRRA